MEHLSAFVKDSEALASEHVENKGANFCRVNFHQAILAQASLRGADLTGANLCRADLYETNFSECHLIDANLQGAQLVRNDFTDAEVVNCTVYGLSAWDLKMDGMRAQRECVIRYRPQEGSAEQTTTVDGLEMASFTYVALNNKNLTRLFNDAGRKWVLLLGRFTERKPLLERLAGTPRWYRCRQRRCRHASSTRRLAVD